MKHDILKIICFSKAIIYSIKNTIAKYKRLKYFMTLKITN